MIPKKSIQLHNFLLLSNFYQPLLLSKQTFEKRFLFPTHSLFQKMDKHENENYDQCDPVAILILNAIQIQSLDIIRTFVPYVQERKRK